MLAEQRQLLCFSHLGEFKFSWREERVWQDAELPGSVWSEEQRLEAEPALVLA
jgi:hypothetical protein